jgi:hypothetical protein
MMAFYVACQMYLIVTTVVALDEIEYLLNTVYGVNNGS